MEKIDKAIRYTYFDKQELTFSTDWGDLLFNVNNVENTNILFVFSVAIKNTLTHSLYCQKQCLGSSLKTIFSNQCVRKPE